MPAVFDLAAAACVVPGQPPLSCIVPAVVRHPRGRDADCRAGAPQAAGTVLDTAGSRPLRAQGERSHKMRTANGLVIALAVLSVPAGALAQSSGGGASGGGGASSGAAGTTSGGAAPSGRATGAPATPGTTTATGTVGSSPPTTGVLNPTAGSTATGQSLSGTIPQAGRPDETRAIPDLRPGPTRPAPNQQGSAATGRADEGAATTGSGVTGNTRSRIQGGGASGMSSTSPAKRSMTDREVCRSIWDPGTHITRQRWNELCERNRAENELLNR